MYSVSKRSILSRRRDNSSLPEEAWCPTPVYIFWSVQLLVLGRAINTRWKLQHESIDSASAAVDAVQTCVPPSPPLPPKKLVFLDSVSIFFVFAFVDSSCGTPNLHLQ